MKVFPQLPINSCEYINDNIKDWKIVFEGSKYPLCEDGFFTLELLFNKGTFPKCGPEAKFITKMLHPNIDSDGYLCINHLSSWKPTNSIKNVIFGILDILDNPLLLEDIKMK